MIKRILPAVLFLIFGFGTAFSADEPRVVSLTPSISKMIELLEAEQQIVGHSNYYEGGAGRHEIVASQMTVNTEKILGLDPDIVLSSDLTRARELEVLKNTGLNLHVLQMPQSFEAVCDQLIRIGELIGHEGKARSIVDRQKARMDSIRQEIPSGEAPRIFIQLGTNPLFAAVPETFMNDYIQKAGGKNVFSDVSRGNVSRESVLNRDPDVMFIILGDRIARDEKQTWQGYPELSAGANGRIFLIDEHRASSPTPVSFVDLVDDMTDLIYN